MATTNGDSTECKKRPVETTIYNNSNKSQKKGHLSTLESLKTHTIVVADTGDFDEIYKYSPEDSTTNPTLILQASKLEKYRHILDDAIEKCMAKFPELTTASGQLASGQLASGQLVSEICDYVTVGFGTQILAKVPGMVSTEVDASLSFDTEASVEKARKLIKLYAEFGIGKRRILIKMATTWESCKAAKILQSEGIQTNMTLLFSLCQAIAAAEAGATLVSPFVGRILDWYKKTNPNEIHTYIREKDPGVISVRDIYTYYKTYGYKTIVMGASFRNTGEIVSLAGCDKLIISPSLLQELSNGDEICEKMLNPNEKSEKEKICMDEKTFRWMLNEDAMATEKLAEGIRNFNSDLNKLKNYICEEIKNKIGKKTA